MQHNPHLSRYRWLVLVAATFTQAASGFAFLGVGTLAGFFRQEFSLGGARTGLIVTAVGLGPVFALIPVGGLLDRYGEREIVAGGALLLGGGVGAAALAPSYPLLLLILLVGGVGYASSQPGGSKAVADWFSPRQRGLAMGIRQTGLPIGGAAAAAALPPVADSFGWPWALFVAAVTAASGGVVFATLYRSPGATVADRYHLLSRLRHLVSSARIRLVLWAGILMVGTQLCIVSYLMLFLRDDHLLPLTQGAWYLFAAQMAGGAGRVVLAAWSDRLGPNRRMWPVEVSLLVVAVTAFVLPLVPATAATLLLMVVAVVFGFFAFGWYGPWVVHVAEVAPVGGVGVTLGLAMTANQIAIAAAPPLFGLILDLSGGYRIPWWLLGALVLVGAIRIGVGLRRSEA